MSIYAPLFYKISGYATARYIFYFFISWEKYIAWNKNKYTKSTNKFIDILITRRYQGYLFVFSDPPLKDMIINNAVGTIMGLGGPKKILRAKFFESHFFQKDTNLFISISVLSNIH